MRKNAVRILVVLSVVLSLIVVSTTIYNDNTSVDVDCKRYYYNQLEYNFERNVYNGIKNIKDFEIDDEDSKSKCATFHVAISDLHFLTSPDVVEEIEYRMERAIQAARNDMPLNTYFFQSYGFNIYRFEILHLPIFLVVVKLNIVDDYSEKTKDWYDQQIINQMDNIPINIDDLATIPDKITKIHNYVVETLHYDNHDYEIDSLGNELRNNVNRASSVYNALVGDHKVVCEGFAKMFKVLCDKYDVPCIVVSSEQTIDDDGFRYGGHMWNYVYIDNLWYIVDCTYDDRKGFGVTKASTDFLMTGEDKYHKPKNDMNFKVPVLSLNKYDDFAIMS